MLLSCDEPEYCAKAVKLIVKVKASRQTITFFIGNLLKCRFEARPDFLPLPYIRARVRNGLGAFRDSDGLWAERGRRLPELRLRWVRVGRQRARQHSVIAEST